MKKTQAEQQHPILLQFRVQERPKNTVLNESETRRPNLGTEARADWMFVGRLPMDMNAGAAFWKLLRPAIGSQGSPAIETVICPSAKQQGAVDLSGASKVRERTELM